MAAVPCLLFAYVVMQPRPAQCSGGLSVFPVWPSGFLLRRLGGVVAIAQSTCRERITCQWCEMLLQPYGMHLCQSEWLTLQVSMFSGACSCSNGLEVPSMAVHMFDTS